MSRRDGSLTATQVVRLVASREIRVRLRAPSFYLATGVLIVIILAMGVASRIAGDDEPSTIKVGLAEPAPEGLATAITQTAVVVDREAEVTTVPDASAARAAVADGDVDVAVVAADNEILFEDDVNDEALVIVQQAWSSVETQRALVENGLTPTQVEEALSIPPLDVTTLEGDEEPNGLAVLTGTLAGILLFISLQTFGTYVLMGVVEEKATAVVEVLLVRARPDQLLAGKIIGIGAAALLQFTFAVMAGIGALMISGVEVPAEIWSAIPMTLVWFLGGYALYSTLFALAGSLVSRQEDAQAAAAPILWTLVAAYMLIFIFGYSPDSTASTLLSMAPPIAPLLMPMRMAAGAASALEVVVALALLIAATWWTWKLSGRIYEQVLLRRGSRISWREAGALLRSD